MGYLTEAKLVNIVDNPVALPATEIKQGDWLVLATIKIASPMILRYRFLNSPPPIKSSATSATPMWPCAGTTNRATLGQPVPWRS